MDSRSTSRPARIRLARRTALVVAALLCSAMVPGSPALGAPPAPAVDATFGADPLAQTTATVSGTVNPNGSEVTDCHVEYGTTVFYGGTAPCTPASPGAGMTDVTVSA